MRASVHLGGPIKGRDFFIYPDYFLFHAGARLGDHGMLDIWPAHAECEGRDRARPARPQRDGVTVERYRRLSLDDAVARL